MLIHHTGIPQLNRAGAHSLPVPANLSKRATAGKTHTKNAQVTVPPRSDLCPVLSNCKIYFPVPGIQQFIPGASFTLMYSAAPTPTVHSQPADKLLDPPRALHSSLPGPVPPRLLHCRPSSQLASWQGAAGRRRGGLHGSCTARRARGRISDGLGTASPLPLPSLQVLP